MTDKINPNPNSVEIKPAFDGRLSYFAVFEEYMKDYRQARLSDNLMHEYKALQGLHIMAAPFIKEVFRNEIKSLLKLSRTRLNSKNKNIRLSAEIPLTDAAEKLHHYGKHLLLPANYDDDDTEDINLEVFMK